MTAKQNETPNERWLPVVGYEGLYDVSNRGRIKRIKPACGTSPGKILRTPIGRGGYQGVILRKNNKKTYHLIHRLVLVAFIGEYPEGMETNHLDGVKTNNYIENLEYATSSENSLHALMVGLQNPLRGEDSPHSKLTNNDVRAIRALLGKERKVKIARQFGVSDVTICDIEAGRTWSWLMEEQCES